MLKDRLRELRKNRNISQREAAGALHLSREAYTMYESGQRLPGCDVLVALADYYGVNVDYLLGRCDFPFLPGAPGDGEAELLACYRHLDRRGKQNVLAAAKHEISRQAALAAVQKEPF